MARPDKAAAVAELSEKFRNSSAAVLTEYRGLTVSQLTQLRRSIGGQATYAVVKNTLTAIAARDAGVTAIDEKDLTGPTAIAFVTGDPVETAKSLRDFARTHPALVIKRASSTAARSPRTRCADWRTSSPAMCCWPSWPAR